MPEGSQINFPVDFEYKGLEDFKGLNTKNKRPSIDDEECSWLENIMPIGKGNARAMWGKGSTFYTAPGGKTIVFAAAYNIATTDYHFYCLSDGSSVQVAVIGGAQTTITNAGVLYNGGNLPAICQYGTSGILIVASVGSSSYYAWDGSTLTAPGQDAPSWLSGQTGGPLATTANSTAGNSTLSGFTSTVGIAVGMVAESVAMGIPVNTFVTGGTSTTVTLSQAPTINTTGGGVQFTWQMPTGIDGTGICTYQNRVFIVNKALILMSASSNGAYFAASNGGNIQTSTDSTLRKAYTTIIAANGYVYPLSDSSIWNISNVTQTVTNNVATASYQYQNSDPQTGTVWPNSVVVFGRAIILINPNGVYDLLGNSATKISDALDGIFAGLDTSVVPTCAVCTLYGIRVLVVCLRGPDYQGNVRNLLCLFDGKKWWIGSQETVPKFIFTQEINSALTVFGTDGTTSFPLFQTPSSTLTKIMQSKLYGGKWTYLTIKQGLRYYLQIDNLNFGTIAPTATMDSEVSSVAVQGSLSSQITWLNASGQVIQFQNATSQNLFWGLPGLFNCVEAANAGKLLGFTLTSTSQDFVIERTGVAFENQGIFY